MQHLILTICMLNSSNLKWAHLRHNLRLVFEELYLHMTATGGGEVGALHAKHTCTSAAWLHAQMNPYCQMQGKGKAMIVIIL